MKLSELPLRQQQVVKLIGRGLSDKQIANILEVEIQTAKNLVYAICKRAKVKGRWALVLHFYDLQEKGQIVHNRQTFPLDSAL